MAKTASTQITKNSGMSMVGMPKPRDAEEVHVGRLLARVEHLHEEARHEGEDAVLGRLDKVAGKGVLLRRVQEHQAMLHEAQILVIGTRPATGIPVGQLAAAAHASFSCECARPTRKLRQIAATAIAGATPADIQSALRPW
eukprot:scaffold336_cov250-Pinguiococcus_pyrenoidosus.AAC.39